MIHIFKLESTTSEQMYTLLSWIRSEESVATRHNLPCAQSVNHSFNIHLSKHCFMINNMFLLFNHVLWKEKNLLGLKYKTFCIVSLSICLLYHTCKSFNVLIILYISNGEYHKSKIQLRWQFYWTGIKNVSALFDTLNLSYFIIIKSTIF